MSSASMLQLSPTHSIKASTVAWIGFGCIAALLGFTMYVRPTLFEKASVAGTCPASTKCCNTCGYDSKKVIIATAVIATVVGAGLGYYLHSGSKANGGAGLNQGVFNAMAR